MVWGSSPLAWPKISTIKIKIRKKGNKFLPKIRQSIDRTTAMYHPSYKFQILTILSDFSIAQHRFHYVILAQ